MGEMKVIHRLLFPLLLQLLLKAIPEVSSKVTRDDFPPDFVFGAGNSAYQVEGAAAEDGRSPSIWDTFTHNGKMKDKSTGDVASDQYHKYKEDVKLMIDTGLEAYKLSISWSRILPNGRGEVNTKGLEYYNNFINELVEHGIQPHVALYHLDLPQVLEDEYRGWLSPKIVSDFVGFSDLCFREFGDRVSHWTTLIEPNIIGEASYDYGIFPPSRCSSPFGINCTVGDSTVEPYIAVHNLLLAHAAAVALYRDKYQVAQNGYIGVNLYTYWGYPLTNSSADINAAQRIRDFYFGWILNPLVFGDYPDVMKENAGRRIPSFTGSQSKQVKGSFDFIGLNHYSSAYVKDNSIAKLVEPIRDHFQDSFAIVTASKNETSSGQFVPTLIEPDPCGLKKMLLYLKEAYGNPAIYIQENGFGLGVKDTLEDTDRIDFIRGFIGSTLDAIRVGSNVKGYFVWSFIDSFEFLAGYTARFGLYHVDFEDDERPRQPKLSALWYTDFIQKGNAQAINVQSTTDLGATSRSSL